jgi:glyoxylase-like metal-dependent hydrolase (beta-lactamase superfamily II)
VYSDAAMLVVRRAVVGPFAENTWLAACSRTGEAILVDPGGEIPRVLALAEPGGFRVKRIFLTHAHVDHVAGAAEARRLTSAPLQLHPGDREWLAMLPQQIEMFGFEEAGEVPEVDHWHEDGETFPLGDFTARVIHTPGHSRGSCALWLEEARVLFCGDTLFAGSVGRTDLPGGDFGELERSITERLFPLGDDAPFHCGHGPSGRLGAERLSNPFVGDGARRGRFL